MGQREIGWCEPENPAEEKYEFTNVDVGPFDKSDWPNEPTAYRATSHFIQHYRQNDRIFSGDIIAEAISSGQMVPAFNDCGAFYTDREGVVYYFIVGWDQDSPQPKERGERVLVTGWPWVYDRELALDSGRYSSRVLTRMQNVNQTLMNEQTADDFWLEYFEEGMEA